MSATTDAAPDRGRRALAIIYGVTAFPVCAWALISLYFFARARSNGATGEDLVQTAVLGALPVVLWILFVVGSWLLARRPSRRRVWRVWSVITSTVLLAFSAYFVVGLVVPLVESLQREPMPNVPMPHPTDRPENQ